MQFSLSLLAVFAVLAPAAFAFPAEKRQEVPAEVPIDLYTLDDFHGESVQLNIVPTGSCVAFPYEFQDNVESLKVGGDIWTCSFWVDVDCNSYDSVFIVEGGGEFSDLGDYFDNNLNAVSCVPSSD